MDQEFDKWIIVKKDINKRYTNFYKPREVWWCSAGKNVGFEESGKGERFIRPVLIIKSFGRDICLVVPLTSSEKQHIYRIKVGIVDNREASVIISQIRVIDSRRLVEKIGYLNSVYFSLVKKAIRDIL